jgi:hypothetical protein
VSFLRRFVATLFVLGDNWKDTFIKGGEKMKRFAFMLVPLALFLSLTSGCATKEYVKQQVEPLKECCEKSQDAAQRAEAAAARAEAAAKKAEKAFELHQQK